MVACLSLRGFPFLSGFYSKDLVLESFLSGGINLVLCLMVVVSTCLTTVYRGWLVYSVFFQSANLGFMGSIVSNEYIIIPSSILGLGALFGGVFLQATVLELNSVFLMVDLLKVVPILCVFFGLMRVFLSVAFVENLMFSMVDLKRKEILRDYLAKIWFLRFLSSDFHSGLFLNLRGTIKEKFEDGYLEFSFGRDRVYLRRSYIRRFYINNQLDLLGRYLIKGVLFVCVVVVTYIICGAYDRQY